MVVDADAGALLALGQEPDALALHDSLALLDDLGQRLDRARDAEEILALRGRRLRARYQIEKLLSRLADPVLARHAVEEIVHSRAAGGVVRDPSGGASLLRFLLENPALGAWSRDLVVDAVRGLTERLRASLEIARERIPGSRSLHEILSLRLDAQRLRDTLEAARAAAGTLLREATAQDLPPLDELDGTARARLEELRADACARIDRLSQARPLPPGLRHGLRMLERLDALLGGSEADRRRGVVALLAASDDSAARACAERSVLWPEDGGFELHPRIGWKAANLCEMSRLGEAGLVPPWFVVSDAAFARVLDVSLGAPAPSLRQAIEEILAGRDLSCAQRSARIRALWSRVRLPEDLAREVVRAYARLEREAPEPCAGAPFVAIRSSALEEDAERAARAGEFDTFLFVRGEEAVLEHLKAAWSGLWTERAIHNREALGAAPGRTGGGVIVQRIVRSRVSGVVQTVNVAEGNSREIVINAGLGLGEGIVSGLVAADHVVVAKEGDLERGPLRFRYIVSDKRERVTFDERKGLGTARVESAYHQRLRPALEYVELQELVAAAARLEEAYGYPLDIEFGIEGARLFLLQARPVGAHLAVLRETLERRPLATTASPSPFPVKEASV